MLTSSTVAEPAAGETLWSAATAYTVGQKAIRISTHRVYQRLVAGTTPTAPEVDFSNWLDVGPTNRWAMFDTLRNSATTAANTMTVVLTPGRRIDSIALMGLEVEIATVSISSAPLGVVYSTSENLILRKTVSWRDYFFSNFAYAGNTVRFDLPPFTNAVITITLSRASGNVALGALVIGQHFELGTVLSQARSDALNFSTVTRDNFGNATLVPRRTVPKTDQQIFTEPERIDKVREIRAALNAVPAVWSGMDDNVDNPHFESLLILGIYKEFSITLDASTTNISLTLEEI
jgi:hypothetical protein